MTVRGFSDAIANTANEEGRRMASGLQSGNRAVCEELFKVQYEQLQDADRCMCRGVSALRVRLS